MNNQIPQFATQIPDTDINRDTYTWNAENNNYAYFPTIRFDYLRHPETPIDLARGTTGTTGRRAKGDCRCRTSAGRILSAWATSYGPRHCNHRFTPKTFNELRYGVQHSGDSNTSCRIWPLLSVQWQAVAHRRQSARPLRLPSTVPFIDQQNVTGRHYITTMYDTMTLIRGEHTFTIGGSFRKTDWNDIGQVFPVPTYATGHAGWRPAAWRVLSLRRRSPASTTPCFPVIRPLFTTC